MNRAFSILQFKSQADAAGDLIITGVASTPTVDKVGDIVIPTGARFATPMPLLLNHKHDQPVGRVIYASPTPKGIPFRATLPRIKEAGELKNRVDLAIHSLESGLICAVSVGFTPVPGKIKRLPSGGSQFDEWDWHELSLCTVGANPGALISSVKSLGPASTAGRLPQELIQRIKQASAGSLHRGVPLVRSTRSGVKLVSTTPRKGVKLLGL